MSARLALVAAVAACTVGYATAAHAWEPIAPSQPVWRWPASFSLNEVGSDDLDIDALEVEAQRAFSDWTAPECSALEVRYDGRTSLTAEQYTHVLSWVEQDWLLGRETIGATISSTIDGDTPTIQWSTMQLNGQHFRWVIGEPSFGFEVSTYTILLHEAGHYLGLGHSEDGAAVMAASYRGGEYTLTADDVAGICALYPSGETNMGEPEPEPDPVDEQAPIDDAPPPTTGSTGPTPNCASDADCHPGRVCIADRCRDQVSLVGTACAFDDQCLSGLCQRQAGVAQAECTIRCAADAQCPGGYVCQGMMGLTTCQRQLEPDSEPDPEPVDRPDDALPMPEPVGAAGAGGSGPGAGGSAAQGDEDGGGDAATDDAANTSDDGGCAVGRIGTRADLPSGSVTLVLLAIAVVRRYKRRDVRRTA